MLAGARINGGVAGYDDVFLGYTDRLQTRPRSIDRDRDTRGLAKLILSGEVAHKRSSTSFKRPSAILREYLPTAGQPSPHGGIVTYTHYGRVLKA